MHVIIEKFVTARQRLIITVYGPYVTQRRANLAKQDLREQNVGIYGIEKAKNIKYAVHKLSTTD